ncbi:MAG: hypothetical protein K8S00_06645, partial [Bacteroidales bacterium]|nr:hypothetical protein [Bacteroidales bacterium]
LDYCSLFAYALLPNHYHLLLRVKDNIEKGSFSRQFGKSILSYTNKINLRDNRNGNLFLSCFRRIKIENEEYLKRLIFYIHHNPTKHGVVDDFRNYMYCSYKIFLSDKPTNIERDEVLFWFGSRDDFIDYHRYLHHEDSIKKLTFKEDLM